MGYFIQNISAGATSATLSGAASNANSFCVGCWVDITGYDQQYQGYPPNFRYFDLAKVTSLNASTGVITWDTPTRFAYTGLPSGFTSSSVTWPYCLLAGGNACGGSATLTDGPSGTVGPARIVPIDTPTHPVRVWGDIEHINVLGNANYSLAAQSINDGIQWTGCIDCFMNDVLEAQAILSSQTRNLSFQGSKWQGIEADKNIVNLIYNNVQITQQDISHTDELFFAAIGSHISFTVGGQFNGNNYSDALNMLFQNDILDSLLNPPTNFSHAIGLQITFGSENGLTVDGVTFVGSNQANQTNNAPINAPQLNANTLVVGATVEPVAQLGTGPNGPNTRLSAPIALGGTIPGGSNTYKGIVDNSSGAFALGSLAYPGATVYVNNAKTSTTVTNITCDGTNVYVDLSTAVATGNTIWFSHTQNITVRNSQGILTGYTWGSAGNNGIRYPIGNGVPNLMVSNNSGN
jgi:hypothetical protein